MLVICFILLSLPSVQTKLARYVTNRVNEKYHTEIQVNKVDLSFFGYVSLKGVLIKDHRKDTLISAKRLQTSIFNFKKLTENDFNFGAIDLTDATFYMKTYKGENNDSFSVFIDSFDDGDPSNDRPLYFSSSCVGVENLVFKLINENDPEKPVVSFQEISGSVNDFKIIRDHFYGNIRGLSFREDHDIYVEYLNTDFMYSPSQMNFKNTLLETASSSLKGDIELHYKKVDLKDFNNKVNFTGIIHKSNLSSKDLKKFYKGFGFNNSFKINTKLSGPLNNLQLNQLDLVSDNNATIKGDFTFRNSFASENGFEMDANIQRLNATYAKLQELLPNALGKTVPSIFERLGTFSTSGKLFLDRKKIDAILTTNTALGSITSDLILSNIENINTASYIGSISLNNFNIGPIVKDSIVGKVTMQAFVDGKGFDMEHLDTNVNGTIKKIFFKEYNYQNIEINGTFKNKLFNGKLIANDPNLSLNFNGKADFNQDVYQYDFVTDIKNANLNKLQFIKRDSLSILKGKIDLKASGNSIDAFVGTASIDDAVYENERGTFPFERFTIVSTVKDSIRSIIVDSPEIISGKMSGAFKFKELETLARNSLGSIYTNYTPYPVSENQYFDFNFKIHSKIIEIFLPQIKLSDKTTIKGSVNADKEVFKLTFKSPEFEAYNNTVEKLRLVIDNTNPIINSQLSVSKFHSSVYDVSKLNLVTVAIKDTLFIRSEFNGGSKGSENFNLSLYHTINAENKSVVGIKKSSIRFKEKDWIINPENNSTNTISFDNNLDHFRFNDFLIAYEDQKIEAMGTIDGDTNKHFEFTFDKVDIGSISPSIENLKFDGILDGKIDFNQTLDKILPLANVKIDEFKINDKEQGTLTVDVEGKNSLSAYDIEIALNNNDLQPLFAKGAVSFTNENPEIDLDVHFEEYNLDAFSGIGGEHFQNIRGTLYGDVTLSKNLINPEINGEMFVDQAGLSLPYLNVDYSFEGTSVIELEKHEIRVTDLTLHETTTDTRGNLIGSIKHNSYTDWFFDLSLLTNNLLVLNTDLEEDSLYYGTAYMKGVANISGPLEQLEITVTGKTNKGTNFVIPLNEIRLAEQDKSLLRYVGDRKQDSLNLNKEILFDQFKGLTVNFNLDVTPDATVKMVLYKETGSFIEGNGAGNLQMEIDTNGKFIMNGIYAVEQGVFKYVLPKIRIQKQLNIKEGGTISWTGDPLEAELDIEAVYQVNNVNPSTLLENYNNNNRINVDLTTKITGPIYNSKMDFDIQLKNVGSDVASEFNFIMNNNNDINFKNTQAIFLLSINSFYNPETIGGDSSSFGLYTMSELISNILIPESEFFKIGLDYIKGNTNNPNQITTNDQVTISVSGALSDKISINSEVGVPVGGEKQTRFNSDIELEMILNDKGNFRGKAFNRQNEIQYDIEEEGYTQGIGLSYRLDFDNGKEFLEKIGLRKKKQTDSLQVLQKNKDSLQNNRPFMREVKKATE